MIKYHTEAERELCEKRMNIIVKLAGIVLFAPAVFCIIQMCNGIFSIWNIFPAVLCFCIGVSVYIPSFFVKVINLVAFKKTGAVETTPQSELDREERELQEDMKNNPEKYKEMEKRKKMMSLDGYYGSLKVWDILVRAVLTVGLAVGSYFSINYSLTFERKNVGCSVVEATVVEQTDKTIVTQEETEDGVTSTEKRSCEAKLSYLFNGETVKETVTFKNISEIKNIKFNIYVDAEGHYLQTTAQVQKFMVIGITLAVFAFIVLTSILLKFTPIFYIMLLISAIGPFVLSLVGFNVSVAELLYFDLTTFIMTFSCVGVYFMLTQYLGRLVLVGHAKL